MPRRGQTANGEPQFWIVAAKVLTGRHPVAAAGGIQNWIQPHKRRTRYYIRRVSLPESYRIVFDQLDREMDLEHLDRVAKLSGEQRLEKMFELMGFLHAVWEAGQREREQK